MFWELIFIILGTVTATCTRPTDFHWLQDDTPTDTSIELFTGNSGSIERFYIEFSHSSCASQGSDAVMVVFCGDATVRMRCDNGMADNVLGLGQNSVIWDHYQHMVLNSHRIILSNDKRSEYANKCSFQPKDLPTAKQHYLCNLDSVPTRWVDQGVQEEGHFPVQLFNSQTMTTVPKKLFQLFEQAVQEKRYEDIFIALEISGKEWVCGKGCLYTNSFKGFKFLARASVLDTIELNERFLTNKQLKYNAESQTIEIGFEDVFIKPSLKFWVQLFLIPKIVYGFWVLVRTKDPMQELFYELVDVVAIASVLLEEVLMHHESEQIVHVVGLGVVFVVLKIVEFKIHTSSAPFVFDASIVIGHLIPIFLLQTMVQELDSYECVVIALAVQAMLVFNDILELFFKPSALRAEATLKGLFLVYLVGLIARNYIRWLSVFFDEIVSLFTYDKTLVVVLFYTVLLAFVVDVWKRKEIFKEISQNKKFI